MQFEIDEFVAAVVTLGDDLARQELHVTHVVELADRVLLVDDAGVVAGPVGDVMVEPALTLDPVVVGHRITDRLGPFGVPVQALSNVVDALGILDVERGDPLAILVPDPRRPKPIRHEPVPAGVERDHLGDRGRAFDHWRQFVSNVDVVPVALLGTEWSLLFVDGVDPLVVGVGVVGRLDLGVLALLA